MTLELLPRLSELSDQDAAPDAQAIFQDARQRIGMIPNVYRAMAHSPALLKAFTTMLDAIETGALDRRLQQQIAVSVAQFDRSTYCLAVNTAIGLHTGLTEDELHRARRYRSDNGHWQAALTFVEALLRKRGGVDDAEIHMLRENGFSDRQITEIVGCVAVNLFANYFNLVARTTADFPAVSLDLTLDDEVA